ncbi:MAG: hypothetical protein PHS41_09485 [Victivallaceae bacterium]|nr:hypothetical protein [Victivallaceae bacterium]
MEPSIAEQEEHNLLYVRNLSPYFDRQNARIGFRQLDAGFAVVHDYNDKQFMNLFVNELPAQTQNRDGVLQYCFEVLLTEKKADERGQTPLNTQSFPSPRPELNESSEDDIPF